MSTLTADVIAEVARGRLGLPPNEVPRLKTFINNALQALAKTVAARADRSLLLGVIDAVPVAGEIDLSDADYNAVLIYTYRLPGAINTQAESGIVFSPVTSIEKLRATTPKDPNYVWYLLRDRKLIFKHPTTGALNTYVTPVRLVGSFVPTLAEMPSVFDEELIAIVMAIGQGKPAGLNLNLGGAQ